MLPSFLQPWKENLVSALSCASATLASPTTRTSRKKYFTAMLRLMVCLLIQIFQKQMGGGPGIQPNGDREIPGRCKLQNFRGRKEKIPWGRLRVYIIQQKQGQSKSLQILSSAARHCTLQAKLCVLMRERFSMRGSLSGMLRSP